MFSRMALFRWMPRKSKIRKPRRHVPPPSYEKADRRSFPYFLTPGEKGSKLELDALEMHAKRRILIAQQIANARPQGDVELEKIANKLEEDLSVLKKIESGDFCVPLGTFLDILRKGYGLEFGSLLAELFPTEKTPKLKKGGAKKATDSEPADHFAFYWHTVSYGNPTAFLLGGDFKEYVWAAPIQTLMPNRISFELLELAIGTDDPRDGSFAHHVHDGLEIITPLFGHVEVTVGDRNGRELKQGDCIHLNATEPHKIRNRSRGSTALMFVVRTVEPLREVD